MSHELTQRADGTYEMAYAGEVPWHGLGQGVAEAMTSEEAITLAHLDWLVDTGPMYGPDKETPVPGWYCSYRLDNNAPLGCGRSKNGNYQFLPWQNHEAFAFLDSLVEDGIMRYESAGSIYGGQQVFILARMAEDWEVQGEKHVSYILVNHSHDIAHTIRILPTEVRVICKNTLQMALSGGEARVIDKIFHRATLGAKLAEAKELLAVTTASTRRLQKFLEKAAKVKAAKLVDPVLRSVLNLPVDQYPDLSGDGVSKLVTAKVDKFLEIYGEEIKVNGPTAYSLVNAVTGYADHAIQYQGKIDDDMSQEEKDLVTNAVAERRYQSIIGGRSQDIKTAAINIIRTAVPA